MADSDCVPVRPQGADATLDLEPWLIERSFAMLKPLCRIGLLLIAWIVLLIDPVLFASGIWGDNPRHGYLVIWHIAAGGYFAVFLALTTSDSTHRKRKNCLAAFMAMGAALFTCYGFVSWMLSGNLSTYAIFLLTLVCVLNYPGPLRKALVVASVTILLLMILLLDGSSIFFTNGVAINLASLAVVALSLDTHLMAMSRALHEEKRMVELERARADAVLYKALPVSIANELKGNNSVTARKIDRMTVLFVDIVGFTRLSATRSPDAVLRILDALFSSFDQLADRHGVEKIKTIGDAYMAISTDDATAVARLALDMLDSVTAFNARNSLALAVRAGIHVGPAIAGVIGLERLHYDVWGDAVNTASRMESSGEAGRIQVSSEFMQATRGAFLFECRGNIEIKGKGSMQTWFLQGPATASVLDLSDSGTYALGAHGSRIAA